VGGCSRNRIGIPAAAILIAALTPGHASAQTREEAIVGAMQRFVNSLSFGGLLPSLGTPAAPPQNLLPPGGGVAAPPPPTTQTLAPPPVNASPSPASLPVPLPPTQVGLALSARYARDSAQPINGGLVWRIYPVKPDLSGGFRPLKEDRSATPNVLLAPGDYVVHVSLGLASAARTVHVKSDVTREVFDIPAGVLRIEGRVGNVRIPGGQISFDLYRGSQFEPGDKRAVAQGVTTGDVLVVPEGTYHIVSNYGDSNAVVRSDIRVQSGKLTDVTVTHRAAVIMLKLVSEKGGEALANTNWSVLTPGGDVIKESIGAFPKVVLAEGDYRAIARNEGKTYERDFKVITGVDGEIEILAR
jgi:hypothetical protein